MTKLIIDGTEFIITGFNRYTNLQNETPTSYANIYFPDNSQYDSLKNVGSINRMSIVIDNDAVYSASDVNAKVSSIDENLSENKITMSATIQFDQGNSNSEEEEEQ